MRAPVRRNSVERLARKTDRAGLVAERSAYAVDERALARAVGTDQPKALSRRDLEINALECDEAAEALREPCDLEQRGRHGRLGRRFACKRPMMPLGAMITKRTSSTPTISRLAAEEMVTVAICCSEPSRIAPINGPTQEVVPPIIGMAMELTA